LGRPEGVALLFDRKRKVIGVMPSALDRKHSYRLRTERGRLSPHRAKKRVDQRSTLQL
jgi:hypothetical protein